MEHTYCRSFKSYKSYIMKKDHLKMYLLCGILGMQDMCDPVMTAYKLVTVDSPYWGFGYRMEQAALAVHVFN
jgi:hypothetical protein